jgi:hypothetical protein
MSNLSPGCAKADVCDHSEFMGSRPRHVNATDTVTLVEGYDAMRIFLKIGRWRSPMRQNRERALRFEIRNLFLHSGGMQLWLTS